MKLPRASLRRLAPLLFIGLLSIGVVAAGWHRGLSFASLVQHYELLRSFVTEHAVGAILLFVACYAAAVALSLPIGVFLTIVGGVLFGAIAGGAAAVVGASTGAVSIFLTVKCAMSSGLGDWLMQRVGSAGRKIAEGFRADAFSYLLFLRLVPLFPFWLVNVVPALCGVRLAPFALATVVGIMPMTFAFAFFGSGLESAIAPHIDAYRACIHSGNLPCRIGFEPEAALTPKLLAALLALALATLIPPAVKRWRGRA